MRLILQTNYIYQFNKNRTMKKLQKTFLIVATSYFIGRTLIGLIFNI